MTYLHIIYIFCTRSEKITRKIFKKPVLPVKLFLYQQNLNFYLIPEPLPPASLCNYSAFI